MRRMLASASWCPASGGTLHMPRPAAPSPPSFHPSTLRMASLLLDEQPNDAPGTSKAQSTPQGSPPPSPRVPNAAEDYLSKEGRWEDNKPYMQ